MEEDRRDSKAKQNKIKKNNNSKKKRLSSLLQELPRVFTNPVTWKKRSKGRHTLAHSNTELNTVTLSRKTMVNKMCKQNTAPYSLLGRRREGKEEPRGPQEANASFDICRDLKFKPLFEMSREEFIRLA